MISGVQRPPTQVACGRRVASGESASLAHGTGRRSPRRSGLRGLLSCAPVAMTAILLTAPSQAQEMSTRDHERAGLMLRTIEGEVRQRYYDSTFTGVDATAHFAAARGQLRAARTNGEAFIVIAQSLVAFNDSHLYFVPPARAAEVSYRWGLAFVGASCYVVAVDSVSAAARFGVFIGDRVLSLDGWRPVRRELWAVGYLLRVLAPRAQVTLTLASPGEAPRDVRVPSLVRERRRVQLLDFDRGSPELWDLIRSGEEDERLLQDEFVTVDDSTLIWRMPSFRAAEQRIVGDSSLRWRIPPAVTADHPVDDGIRRARRHRSLVLDLRGNRGGDVSALTRLIGRIFPRDIHVGELRERHRVDTLTARSRGGVFTGRLVVLVDSRSASASELLARVVQLEQRGSVIGDRTAGAVRRSRGVTLSVGGNVGVSMYGLSVTDADVIMADGGTLEGVGVRPDELLLPSGADLAAGRDPVLARALQLLGHPMDATQAGRLLSPGRHALDLW